MESEEVVGGVAHAPDDTRPEGDGTNDVQPPPVKNTPPPVSTPSKRSTLSRWLPLALLVCVLLAAPLIYFKQRQSVLGGLKAGAEQVKDILTGAPPRDPYAEAVKQIEEDRGEATGRKAEVEIPAELKQYSEARRFLAIQGAAAREAGINPPHDFAELAGMIEAGRELVEVPRLGRGFVLYGVGLTATGALTHYDLKAKKVVPLYANVEEVEAAERELSEERERLSNGLHEIEVRLKELDRKERETRAQLLADSAARKKELAAVTEKEKLLAAYYGKPGAKGREKTGARLFEEYAALEHLARDFGGRSYDLHDATAAREFQARMLSYVRPAALAVIEELGTAYESKFGRPLPITSLVRTVEYQLLLRESGNPNAGDFAPPPHTSGFAFDVYYRYMTAAEQSFVMGEIARLERAGRVEALRELRDHYHVFAFAEGHPPPADAVDKILGKRSKQTEADKPEKKETKPAKAPPKGKAGRKR